MEIDTKVDRRYKASNLETSQILKELVKAEKVLSQAIPNSDFTVIEVDGWGPPKKSSSLWFQFLDLKVPAITTWEYAYI